MKEREGKEGGETGSRKEEGEVRRDKERRVSSYFKCRIVSNISNLSSFSIIMDRYTKNDKGSIAKIVFFVTVSSSSVRSHRSRYLEMYQVSPTPHCIGSE